MPVFKLRDAIYPSICLISADLISTFVNTVTFWYFSSGEQGKGDDIGYTLEELSPAAESHLCLVWLCIVAVRRIDGQDTSWQKMMEEKEQLFRELVLMR